MVFFLLVFLFMKLQYAVADGNRYTNQNQCFRVVPADEHWCCRWVNRDFGMSPFRRQLSGKPLLATA
jgi:hypothetical protein